MLPNEIYENPTSRDQDAISNANGTGDFVTVQRIEYNKGIFVYTKEHAVPHKGMPTMEAVHAINQVKALIKHSLKALSWRILFMNKRKLLHAFNEISYSFLSPYILKYEFMTNTAQGVCDFIFHTLMMLGIPEEESSRTAKIISHLVELDGAYRFRLMDLCNASSPGLLKGNPRKEIKRLMALNRERDYAEVSDKLSAMGNLLSLALLIPKIRKAFVWGIDNTVFSKLRPDETDQYWMRLKKDYKYGI